MQFGVIIGLILFAISVIAWGGTAIQGRKLSRNPTALATLFSETITMQKHTKPMKGRIKC